MTSYLTIKQQNLNKMNKTDCLEVIKFKFYNLIS